MWQPSEKRRTSRAIYFIYKYDKYEMSSCPTYAGLCTSGNYSTYYCCPLGYELKCATPEVQCPIDPTTGAITNCDPNRVINTHCQKKAQTNAMAEIRGCTENVNGSTLELGSICPCGPTTVNAKGHCSDAYKPKPTKHLFQQ